MDVAERARPVIIFFLTASVMFSIRRYSSFLLYSSTRREVSNYGPENRTQDFPIWNEMFVVIGFPIDTGQVSSSCVTIRICIDSILSFDLSTNIEIQMVSVE